MGWELFFFSNNHSPAQHVECRLLCDCWTKDHHSMKVHTLISQKQPLFKSPWQALLDKIVKNRFALSKTCFTRSTFRATLLPSKYWTARGFNWVYFDNFHDVVIFWLDSKLYNNTLSAYCARPSRVCDEKKKFCQETFLTSSRGILIARNFSKEKNILMWGNGAISASESLHLIFLTYLHEMQVW